MKTKTNVILRHKTSGLYFSRTAGHTTDLWQAWRFSDDEYVLVWMTASYYRPFNPDDYEIVPVQLTIEVNENVQ